MINGTTHKKELSQYDIDVDKFWSNVNIKSLSECWEWQRALNTGGYGLFSVKAPSDVYERTGRTSIQILAHRVAASTVMDVMPADQVMHECDNRQCCNPNHLRTGTPLDNHRDMVAKGRGLKGRKTGPRLRRFSDVQSTEPSKIDRAYPKKKHLIECLEEMRSSLEHVCYIPKKYPHRKHQFSS